MTRKGSICFPSNPPANRQASHKQFFAVLFRDEWTRTKGRQKNEPDNKQTHAPVYIDRVEYARRRRYNAFGPLPRTTGRVTGPRAQRVLQDHKLLHHESSSSSTRTAAARRNVQQPSANTVGGCSMENVFRRDSSVHWRLAHQR
jgi:hypothetical protein